MRLGYSARHAVRRHRGRKALALTATSGLLALAAASGAFADTVALDGDSATTGGSPAAFTLDNGNCEAGDSVAGAITVKYNGAADKDSQHFNAGETLAVNFFVPSDSGLSASVDSSPVVMPGSWTSSSSDLVIPFTTTLGASTADDTYQIGVSVVGADYAVGQDEGSGRPQYGVNVDCVDDTNTGGGNNPPVVDAGGPYSGNEGSAIAIDGSSATDADNDTLTYSWGSTGDPGNDSGASCSFDDPSALQPNITCNDDGTYTLTLSVTDGKVVTPVTDTATLTVSNVAPAVTAVTVSPSNVLAGQPVTFSATADDPSSNDDAAGFAFKFDGNAETGTDSYTTSFSTCGSHTVSVTATDKDGGTSDAFTSDAVGVFNATFRSPLTAGVFNKVQKGSVVPVKIWVGCGTAFQSGLSPTIQLMSGEVDPNTDPNDTSLNVTTASVSNADGSGVMREVDGQYIYNLQVPAAAANTLFTVRVRPFGSGGGSTYVVLQVRK